MARRWSQFHLSALIITAVIGSVAVFFGTNFYNVREFPQRIQGDTGSGAAWFDYGWPVRCATQVRVLKDGVWEAKATEIVWMNLVIDCVCLCICLAIVLAATEYLIRR